MEDLRYPIGKFSPKPTITHDERIDLIRQIEEAPKQIRAAVTGLNDTQLNTTYREGGWTVRQVVHHLPDSHMNAYTRFKLAFTENQPTIKPYDEKAWAELIDNKTAPVEPSLALLEHLHYRWVMFLKNMKPEDFARKLVHPESGLQDLDRMLQLYAWHGRHHTAHVTSLRKRMGW